MSLTKKQKDQLGKALLQYLAKYYPDTAASFAKEAALPPADEPEEAVTVLERKWTTILRLQNRINDLEKENNGLKDELSKRGLEKRGADEKGDEFSPKVPERKVLKGHRANVTFIALHPDYTEAATCSEDGTVKVWEFDSGDMQKNLTGHTGAVNCVCYDATGKVLASCSADMSIKIWDCLNDFSCVRTLVGHDHNVSSVEFSKSGDFLISASRDKTIRLWDVGNGYANIKKYVGHDEWVRRALFNESGSMIVSCADNECIVVWLRQKETPHLTIKAHQNKIDTLALLEGQKLSFLMANSDLLKKRKAELKKDELVRELLIISGSRDKSIRMFSGLTGECLFSLMGHDNWVKGLAVHASGKWLYSASDDKTVRVWDLLTGKQARRLEAHQHFVGALAVSSKYRVMVTGGADCLLKLWALG